MGLGLGLGLGERRRTQIYLEQQGRGGVALDEQLDEQEAQLDQVGGQCLADLRGARAQGESRVAR